MMAEAVAFISAPDKGKRNVANTAMVLNSLASTLPLVMPDASICLEYVKSAPNSPEKEGMRKSKNFLKNLSRSRSPRRHKTQSQSDPEESSHSSSSSPQSRPKWLPLTKNKKRKMPSSSSALNVDSFAVEGGVPVTDSVGCNMSSLNLEATSVHRLPGRSAEDDEAHVSTNDAPVMSLSEVDLFPSHHSDRLSNYVPRRNSVPKIRVLNESNEDVLQLSPSVEDMTMYSIRKNSQSSRCSSGSGLVSIGTSGVGSLLSPSGDESYSGSDLESPLSPYSGASSFTSDTAGELSDSDPIEKDYYAQGDKENVTTPTPMQGDDASPTSGGEGKDLKGGKTKKDKLKSGNVWTMVRNAVKAWSPFAVQFKKKYYPWVQLAGHEGNFMPGGENGTIMKKCEPRECNALCALMDDPLKNFVPEFKGEIDRDGEMYVEMTDLLREFNEPAVMDIKMGVRTYLEEEIAKKHVLREDMYLKMISVDPKEPTSQEHAQAAITKPRYMQWREGLSSTSNLGFRIEGIKTLSGKGLKNFKKTKERGCVMLALRKYVEENPSVKGAFLQRLQDIRVTLQSSTFFSNHELIGTSLLFVYDSSGMTGIHLIDFGKTTPLPNGMSITHLEKWVEGNHEDGYLFGLNNLINIWKEI